MEKILGDTDIDPKKVLITSKILNIIKDEHSDTSIIQHTDRFVEDLHINDERFGYIIMGTENAFRIQIKIEEENELKTVEDLIDFVYNKIN